MQKLTIRFNAKGLLANNLHVILDGNDLGVVESGESGSVDISNDQHLVYFGYYVPAIGGEDVPITSEEIYISATSDDAPELLEYIYDVKIINNSSVGKNFKRVFDTSRLFSSKQEVLNRNAKEDFSIAIQQLPENIKEIERKKKINAIHLKVESVMLKLEEHVTNDILSQMDFDELNNLTEEEKQYPNMENIYVPALVERTYATLVRLYLEEEIGIDMMFAGLAQLMNVPYAKSILGDSFKHANYLWASGNAINSVLHRGKAVEELRNLAESDFEIIHFNRLPQNEMRDKWNSRDKYDFMKKEKSVCKVLYDQIVNVDKDETYFDDFKKSILKIAIIERQNPEMKGLLQEIKLAAVETFGPIVCKEDKAIVGTTVDMIIADALYYSKVNFVDTINDELTTFLNVICPEYKIKADQYCILQEIFAWLNAYRQEKMVLEAMVNNAIPRTKEQDARLTFLNSTKTVSSNQVSTNYSVEQLQDNVNEDVVRYDYQFMTMSEPEIFDFFNSISLENKTYDEAIVVDEWTNSIEMRGITWNSNTIKNSIDKVMKENFGERFVVSIEKSVALSEMSMEETDSIIISEKEGCTMPWLSFLILGEQIIINHMNISIYTLYRPNKVELSENMYVRNQAIQKSVLSLKKKQNPKVNNLIHIISELVVKELENWVNTSQTQNIYE